MPFTFNLVDGKYLLSLNRDLLAILDFDGAFCEINGNFLSLLGYSERDLKRRTLQHLAHPEDRPQLQRRLDRLINGRAMVSGKFRLITRDQAYLALMWRGAASGERRQIYLSAYPLEVGHAPALRPASPGELAQAQPSVQALTRHCREVFLVVDGEGVIRFAAGAAEAVLGISADPAFPGTLFDGVHPSDHERLRQALAQSRNHPEQSVNLTYRWRRPDGTAIQVGAVFGMDPSAAGDGILCNLRDLTERSIHDPLTHLPNRTLFIERLERLIDHRKRNPQHQFAVLLIDLDRFKNINDTMGHSKGDLLLIQIAQRLLECVKSSDMVARFGGDEFILLLDEISESAEAAQVAKKIQEKVTWPFFIDQQEVFLTLSIGITAGKRPYANPEEILRDADIALHRSKSQGKSRHEFFSTGMFQVAFNRMQMEIELRKVMERLSLQLYYQPIINLVSGAIFGFEALVRWPHPELGFISPEEFIPVAEEIGSIIDIGRWTLTEACEQLARWQQEFGDAAPQMISVNLSSRQFDDPGLIAHIDELLARTGVDPLRLRLEITETAIMEHSDYAADLLAQLRDRGIRLALDDFGTGYSSLAYLHRFPVSYLKIDRSFISKMTGVPDQSANIVQTIVTLAHNLEMEVIAEGVETAQQLAGLREMKCDYGQGYYFGKAVIQAEASALIADAPTW